MRVPLGEITGCGRGSAIGGAAVFDVLSIVPSRVVPDVQAPIASSEAVRTGTAADRRCRIHSPWMFHRTHTLIAAQAANEALSPREARAPQQQGPEHPLRKRKARQGQRMSINLRALMDLQ